MEKTKRIEGWRTCKQQKIFGVTKDEVRKDFKKMKNGKVVVPDAIFVDVWKCLGERAVEFLT